MEEKFKRLSKNVRGLSISDFSSEESLDKMYKLMLEDKEIEINKEDITEVYLYCLHYKENKNYSKFLRNIFINIDRKHPASIVLLARYFSETQNFNEMINYLNMAIDLGSIEAIRILGQYYKSNEKDKAISIFRIIILGSKKL